MVITSNTKNNRPENNQAKKVSIMDIAKNLYPSLCIFGKIFSIIMLIKFDNFH